MIREILTYPNPKLREVSIPVPAKRFGTIRLGHLIQDMIETMKHHKGIGLSAVQIGTPWRVMVIQAKYPHRAPAVLINPIVERLSPTLETYPEEGCLSFPGLYFPVTRPNWLSVRWTAPDAVSCFTRLKEIEARCFLHELDHLDGKLLADQPNYPT